jgi:hypothetical protein
MDWQQLVSLTIVGTAAVLLLAGKVRSRRFRFGRDGHCGCAVSPSTPPPSVVFHARKGERPRVFVKMK